MPQENGQTPQDPDDLDRFLREITSGHRADGVIKEPSAAERARRQVPGGRASRMGWRARHRAAKLREPVTSARQPTRERPAKVPPADPRSAPRARRSSPARKGLQLTAAIALLAGASYGLSRSGLLSPARRSPAVSNPLPGLRPAFTVADPFAGTPAELWAAGVAAIVPPVAGPVGGFSAAKVAGAYGATKKLLIANALSPQTLAGGPPTAFARLLTAQQRSFFLSKLGGVGVDSRGYTRSTRAWVVSFAPGTQIVGDVIKVYGVMSATTAVDSKLYVLRISFNYLFAYPVQRPGQPRTRMRIVVHLKGDVDFAPWNDPGGPLQAWWVPSGGSGSAGARCDIHDGFVHPDFPGAPPDRSHRSGAPIDPYSLKVPISYAPCWASTGT